MYLIFRIFFPIVLEAMMLVIYFTAAAQSASECVISLTNIHAFFLTNTLLRNLFFMGVSWDFLLSYFCPRNIFIHSSLSCVFYLIVYNNFCYPLFRSPINLPINQSEKKEPEWKKLGIKEENGKFHAHLVTHCDELSKIKIMMELKRI